MRARLGKAALVVGAGVLATGVLAGCGSSSSGGGSASGFCDDIFAIEGAFNTAPFDDNSKPADVEAYYKKNIASHVQDFGDDAVDEVEADALEMVATAEKFGRTGDPTLFEKPAFTVHEDKVDQWMFDNCDAHTYKVDAVDYAFKGLPADLPAGRTIIKVTNKSASGEAHEFGLARKKTDITVDELINLPQDEAEKKIEPQAGGFVPAPGKFDFIFVDFKKGNYAVVCFVSKGSVNGKEGDGPPHAMLGMRQDVTVGS